ncbi:MAG: N-acetylmuramoyl-L-alanine amidase [Bacteroidia bacterium]|nr:N-acetylmuramoyl-L-alanine amidase [Bacteroidia bacterium]
MDKIMTGLCLPQKWIRLSFVSPAVVFLFSLSRVFAQPLDSSSEHSSYQIDFTQTQLSQHQLNVISTSQGLMPLRQGEESYYVSITETIPILNAKPFLTLTPVAAISNYDPAVVDISVRFSTDQIGWGTWSTVARNHELEPNDPRFIGEMVFVDSSYNYFQYRITFNTSQPSMPFARVSNIRFDFFSPGSTQPVNPEGLTGFSIDGMNGGCLCPLPVFATRSDWNCPDGDTPSCNTVETTSVSHLIVHHSAGINVSDNWGAVVLSIWNLHVNTNGWCDVGYNWIIDPNGMIYEGRGGGNNVKGAHFCGANSGTMGVCMLGNFENAEPTAAALTSLTQLLAWKSCDVNIGPNSSSYHLSTGKTLMTISGHQDGCATLCPGDNLYNKLPLLRSNVNLAMEACEANTSVEGFVYDTFHLFPNPNYGSFSLVWDTPIRKSSRVEIFNLLGEKVFVQETPIVSGNEQMDINTGNLPAGIYNLRFDTGETSISKSIQILR